jgi:hypothetical protein
VNALSHKRTQRRIPTIRRSISIAIPVAKSPIRVKWLAMRRDGRRTYRRSAIALGIRHNPLRETTDLDAALTGCAWYARLNSTRATGSRVRERFDSKRCRSSQELDAGRR